MSRLQHPKYVEISHAIEARIRSGALDRGRMPSVRSIAEEFGVSIVTAVRALRILRDRGLVRTVERSGCFVTPVDDQVMERWALCQRITSGPWQRAAGAVFRSAFERVAQQQAILVSADAIVLREGMSEHDMQRQVRAAMSASIAGIFFLPSRIDEAGMRHDEVFLRVCQAAEMPVVLLERDLRGTNRPLDHDLAASDDSAGGMSCTQHLLERGRRRIVFITGSPCSSHDGCVAGYLYALYQAASSLAPGWQPIVLEQSAGLSDKQTFRELADRVLGLQADGVVCYEDYMAMGLILELLARGVRVPADVAVTGFDDLPIGNSFAIGVTSYALAGEDIARQALRLMRERVRHPGQRPVRVHVPGELIVRESTAGVGNHSRSAFRVTPT
jgi:LacI family transcriptional regulator